MASFYKAENYVQGDGGAGNNWAIGYYTRGNDILQEIMDIIRKEVEGCDSLQGFQITHSLGGGTGSGLGTLIIKKLKDSFPKALNASFSVYPSPKVSDVVVEPYNAILSINQILNNGDLSFTLDNDALYSMSLNLLKVAKPKYEDLNAIISSAMSLSTTSIRFSSHLNINCDLRKMAVNLTPFPRMHFYSLNDACVGIKRYYPRQTVMEMTDGIWSARNCLARYYPEDGKYLCADLLYVLIFFS